MLLLNPRTDQFQHLDVESQQIIRKVIDWFEQRGKQQLKADDQANLWYSDFLQFVKEEKIFATFLTPKSYGDGAKRWDTYRLCQLNEVLGFYGLAYWYTWQVTILGLGPLWMSENESIKRQTAELLDQGGIFAFGLSEQQHGADIYSSSMRLVPTEAGSYQATGEKYYIGNGNQAALVSTFGKLSDTEDYVFFAVKSNHEKYRCIKNVINSQCYVAHYALENYPITENEVLAKGQQAWDMALNTVNVGKFNLGWASIGICTHAFYEAINHAAHRELFGSFVTDFVHVKQLFIDSYTRLVAMKLFALRGADYLRAASAQDRRYLLYTPMVKMKVTTQGEEVINLLWDVIAAKGFEKDMYFDMATRDIRALPKLEGTVHVNMALIIKFMPNFFFKPSIFPDIPTMDQPQNDDFLFRQGPTKGLRKVKFHDYKKVYDNYQSENVTIFKKQIRLLKILLLVARPNKNQIKDFDFLLNIGELFTLVVYGQLILENATLLNIDNDLIDQIFDFMIRDFSKFAMQLYTKPITTLLQRALCKRMIKHPVNNTQRFEKILREAYALKDQYQMR